MNEVVQVEDPPQDATTQTSIKKKGIEHAELHLYSNFTSVKTRVGTAVFLKYRQVDMVDKWFKGREK